MPHSQPTPQSPPVSPGIVSEQATVRCFHAGIGLPPERVLSVAPTESDPEGHVDARRHVRRILLAREPTDASVNSSGQTDGRPSPSDAGKIW